MLLSGLLFLLFAAGLAAAFATTALAWRRLSRAKRVVAAQTVPVSIVRPVCGLEPFSRETLESGFLLDHPSYELIFCAHAASDPVVPLLRRLIAAHPKVPAQILFGEDGRSANPKLDNCLKGWAAARHEWVVLADSNVEMPRDYLARLLAARRPDTGLVCSMPLGTRPEGFGGAVECAFLNGFQARWQYAAESVGEGYAQGKSMLWHKPFLESRGGLLALGSEAAEDAAATKLVRSAGRAVHLVDAPFAQPIGRRRLADTWRRQLRWARLRRVTFPLLYGLEFLTSPLAAAAGLAATAPLVGVTPWIVPPLLLAAYGAEIALVRRLGWGSGLALLPAAIVRDLMLPLIWLAGFTGREVRWHGRAVPVTRARPAAAGAMP